jgi:ADP-ribose pyrophosphatase YjhB (NUDIX family)
MDILPLLDELQSMARDGLRWSQDPHDRRNYTRLLELVSLYYGAVLDLPPAEVRQRLASRLGPVSPSVGANAAIFDARGAILLQLRADSGRWGLPGGGVTTYETPAEAAVRETKEETGLDCRVVELVDVVTHSARLQDGPHARVTLLYLCETTGGTLQGSDEGPELRYWQIAHVPAWSAGYRSQAEAAYACWLARQA